MGPIPGLAGVCNCFTRSGAKVVNLSTDIKKRGLKLCRVVANDGASLMAGRRGFLTYSGAALGAALVPTTTTAASRLEDQYRTVIDVVEEGADNGGNESITPLLRDLRGSNTLLKFPEGRYYMDSQLRFTGFEQFGMVGYDATLVPANFHDFDGPQFRLFRLGTADRPGRDLRVEGFRVDQTASDTGIRFLNGEVTDGLFVQDIYINGRHDSGTWGPGLFNITEPGGSGIVRRFRAGDGGVHVDDTPNAGNMWRGPTGIVSNKHHRGRLTFEGCVLGGFPDNGLYCWGGTGEIRVNRGWFQNSATASIRLGARRSRISGAVIRINRARNRETRQHGVRLDYCDWATLEGLSFRLPRPNGYALRVMDDVGGVSMRDCDLTVGQRTNTAIRIDPETGPVYINGADITFDGGGNAIRVLGQQAGRVGLQDVSITGDASGSPMYYAIYAERDGVRFRDLHIDQRGDSNRRGIELNGRDSLLYECELTTTDYPIVVNGDEAWIERCHATTTEGRASINLSSVAGDNIRLKNNEFPDGVRDSR